MARPKKKIEEKKEEFKPSKYQEAIFDFVSHGQGNAVIEAVPGAGKTTTALKCMELMKPEERVLLIAFNSGIVEELKKRTSKFPNNDNIYCRTFHSLGLKMLNNNYPHQIDTKPCTFKYQSYIHENIFKLSNGYYGKLNSKDKRKYFDNIMKYVDFGRYYMCSSVSDMSFIEKHYSVPTYYNEKEVALKAMEWGEENIETIDYTDMIWLPNVLNCKPYNLLFDWIVCDECQDIMTAERELLLKCTKMSTRMLFFGEKLQCIYSFMGSDYRSFDELKKLPNTISLPLSISYRCSQAIVNHLKKFNEHVEARENAPEGSIKFNVDIGEIQDGDMVLCRNNAPLLKLYCELIKDGKPAYIRGKDIGKSFINLIDKSKETKLNKNIDKKGLFSNLYNNLMDEIDTIMNRYNVTFDMAIQDSNIEKIYDQIQALDAISDDIKTCDELKQRIKTLFKDSKSKGIQLSTVHKAKGLECDNVFICCQSLLLGKMSMEDWEKEQERNLAYVAYSRPKNNLYFMDEKDFSNFIGGNDGRLSEIKRIKSKVFALYGSNGRCQEKLPEDKTYIFKNVQPTSQKRKKTINIGNIDNNSKVDSLTTSVKKRKKKN